MNSPFKSALSNRFLFLYLVLLIVFIRFLTLLHYSFQFTGNDDIVFWNSTVDYSKGIFYEPFFYGQNYNFSFESVLAVPLIWCGVPVYYALPIVSAFIGVFPFVFIAAVLYRRNYYVHSFFFLLILLTLPTEYDIMTTITRGFTSGMFFTAFLIFPLLNPHTRKSFVLLGIFASLAYVMNPNSIIFSSAVGAYLFFENMKKPSFYIITAISALPAFLMLHFSEQFYVHHPEYLAHSMWDLQFYFELLLEGLSHLDKFFRYLTPTLWFGNWLVVLVIIVLGTLMFRRNWKKALSIWIAVLIIIFSLGVNKVNDDIGVIFLSSTRMFLAIPLLLGLTVFWFKEDWKISSTIKLVFFSIATLLFVLKIMNNQSVIAKHTDKRDFGAVAVKDIDELKSECTEIKQLTEKYQVDLVAFVPQGNISTSSLQFYDYGCPVLQKKSFLTVLTLYERRTWVFEKEYLNRREKLMLFNINLDLNKIEEIETKMDCEVIDRKRGIVLIRNNRKSLLEISRIFHFDLKRSPY